MRHEDREHELDRREALEEHEERRREDEPPRRRRLSPGKRTLTMGMAGPAAPSGKRVPGRRMRSVGLPGPPWAAARPVDQAAIQRKSDGASSVPEDAEPVVLERPGGGRS